jgi:hypothetical protein
MTGLTCCRASVLSLVALGLLWLTPHAPADSDPATVLKASGIAPTPAAVEVYVRSWIVDDRLKGRIDKLIAQLGSEDYDQREQATEELARIGPATLESVASAARSKDPEVRQRATSLLTRLDSVEGRRTREAQLSAALQWLGQTRPTGAAPLILDVLPHLSSPAHREAATRSLWACTTPGEGARLRRLVQDGPAPLRATALPALELAEGDSAVELLRAFQKDPDPAVRLGAARALLDRRPADAVAVLLGLLECPDADTRTQAAWLLQQTSGLPAEADRALDWTQTVARWRAWATSPAADKPRPLGTDRLRLERYGLLLSVVFTEEMPALKDGYGPLRYETNCAGKASVARGLLRLDGQHNDGNQSLFIQAEKLVGKPAFPRAFEVRATLGGEAEMSGTWHVGVSIGNVRVLFHPGFTDGAFRVEQITTQRYLHANENMNFTPAAGVLHELTIKVIENRDDTVTLDVRITESGPRGRTFQRTVQIKAADIGPLSRVGLERSGRTGGAALFGALSIRQ